MHVISTQNVHTALPKGIDLLRKEGIWTDTRNGLALVSPVPVTTQYSNPKERVIFWPERDANPFFHIFEAMWMLLGRDDVESVAGYAKQMREYSDDGKTLRGAYGHRWRNWFDTDNLKLCIEHLKVAPNSRRVVLPMFDPDTDTFNHNVKDIPCNLVIHFRKSPLNGRLDMTVFCRSNDIVWGAYGANAVHFSFLQEYVAICVGMQVGQYWQVSDDFHIYKPQYEKLSEAKLGGLLDVDQPLTRVNPYMVHSSAPTHPLMSIPEGPWLSELARCLDQKGRVLWEDPFISAVLAPILRAHHVYKITEGEERYVKALDELAKCSNWDWYQACSQWINRRYRAWERAKDDGVNYES